MPALVIPTPSELNERLERLAVVREFGSYEDSDPYGWDPDELDEYVQAHYKNEPECEHHCCCCCNGLAAGVHF